MVRSSLHIRPGWIVAGIIILSLFASSGMAQEPDLLSIIDTSYFKAGEDDWNLVESVIKGDHANILLLLKRGADPNSSAEGGLTALMFAAEGGDLTTVKLLVLNGADLELAPIEKTTPLMVAVLNNHFVVAQFLLGKGANPDARDEYRVSALLYAAAINNYQIADLLLYFGASDTLRDREGNNALMTAVFFGNLETADVLLQNNLEPDATDKKRNTPLMVAAQQGEGDMIKLLLEYGAGLEKVNNKNYTPLAHAIRYKQDTAAMILIDSGANVHHSITPNRNMYDLAVRQNLKKTRILLKEKGAAPVPKPDFSEIHIGWGNSYRSNEHLMQFRVSWVDNKFGIYGQTGIDFRPVFRKVQVSESDMLTYQYRESRWTWAHGAGKYFKLLEDQSGFHYGLYGELYGLLSFPKYRGIRDNPPVKYNVVPAVGVYLSGKVAGIRAGVERYNFGTLFEGPWKMNITLFVKISYQNADHVYKDIQY